MRVARQRWMELQSTRRMKTVVVPPVRVVKHTCSCGTDAEMDASGARCKRMAVDGQDRGVMARGRVLVGGRD